MLRMRTGTGIISTDNEKMVLAELLSRRTDIESYWTYKQPWIQRHGYMLRPRYEHGWVPSWEAARDFKIAPDAEDAIQLPHLKVIDATRIFDGRLVCLKWVPASTEADILRFFSSSTMRDRAQNHCAPVLEMFSDGEKDEASYVVMPFLRPVNSPPFEIVEDIIDFIDQTLEGLLFMHEHGVAHRECAIENIMMEASSLFPRSFHPVNTNFLPDLSAAAVPLMRFAARIPVRYYFTSFANAVMAPDMVHKHPNLVTGLCSVQQQVPELDFENDTPYDPFKVDVYVLGKQYMELCNQYTNLDFLQPLLGSMMCEDPCRRPDASVALHRWRQLRRELPMLRRFTRLRFRSHPLSISLILDVVVLAEICMIATRRLLGRLLSGLINLLRTPVKSPP